MNIAICPHISLEHYRGGEKWAAHLANRLDSDGIDVGIRSLPYTPQNRRRIKAHDVLNESVSYQEKWRHDLSEFDTAYIFYHPFCELFFTGDVRSIAGIHSWVYLTNRLYESHYGVVPTTVKILYRVVGKRELSQFDAVHTVTDTYESPHSKTYHIPNFVDTNRFRPDRASRAEEFTILATAAHLPEKGWEVIREVARTLNGEARVAVTGDSDDEYIADLGFLDEGSLADAYSRAHVVLHPTRIDADSLVIKEALASGTPVVTTPLPTHPPEGEAILYGTTAGDLVARIRTLRWEWMNGTGYDNRCREARAKGEQYEFETLYPKLKELLLSDELNTKHKECSLV